MGLPLPGLDKLLANDGPVAALAGSMLTLAKSMTEMNRSNGILADSNYTLARAIEQSTARR